MSLRGERMVRGTEERGERNVRGLHGETEDKGGSSRIGDSVPCVNDS